jgi:hypothetical protein
LTRMLNLIVGHAIVSRVTGGGLPIRRFTAHTQRRQCD